MSSLMDCFPPSVENQIRATLRLSTDRQHTRTGLPSKNSTIQAVPMAGSLNSRPLPFLPVVSSLAMCPKSLYFTPTLTKSESPAAAHMPMGTPKQCRGLDEGISTTWNTWSFFSKVPETGCPDSSCATWRLLSAWTAFGRQ